MGLQFETIYVNVDELPFSNEPAKALVKRLALAKAHAGFDVLALSQQATPEAVVLGADTIVVVDGNNVLGKPSDAEQASEMLGQLSGGSHCVLTAVAIVTDEMTSDTKVINNAERFSCHVISEAEVTFRILDQEEIDAYWKTGEPADKAGAYAIQGLAGVFVKRISGSYSAVVGLPLFETSELLKKAGINSILGCNEKPGILRTKQ